MGVVTAARRVAQGGLKVLLVLSALSIGGCLQHSEAVVTGPVIIDGKTVLESAAQFNRGRLLGVDGDAVIKALGGSYDRDQGKAVLVLTLNSHRIVISPTKTDITGELQLIDSVPVGKQVFIRADPFTKAFKFAFPEGTVNTKGREVYVQTHP